MSFNTRYEEGFQSTAKLIRDKVFTELKSVPFPKEVEIHLKVKTPYSEDEIAGLCYSIRIKDKEIEIIEQQDGMFCSQLACYRRNKQIEEIKCQVLEFYKATASTIKFNIINNCHPDVLNPFLYTDFSNHEKNGLCTNCKKTLLQNYDLILFNKTEHQKWAELGLVIFDDTSDSFIIKTYEWNSVDLRCIYSFKTIGNCLKDNRLIYPALSLQYNDNARYELADFKTEANKNAESDWAFLIHLNDENFDI